MFEGAEEVQEVLILTVSGLQARVCSAAGDPLAAALHTQNGLIFKQLHLSVVVNVCRRRQMEPHAPSESYPPHVFLLGHLHPVLTNHSFTSPPAEANQRSEDVNDGPPGVVSAPHSH